MENCGVWPEVFILGFGGDLPGGRSFSIQLAQSPQKLSDWSKIIQPCRG